MVQRAQSTTVFGKRLSLQKLVWVPPTKVRNALGQVISLYACRAEEYFVVESRSPWTNRTLAETELDGLPMSTQDWGLAEMIRLSGQEVSRPCVIMPPR